MARKGHAVARVTFTANREMVANALAAGLSAKAIYEQNRPALGGIGYRQFVRYVNGLTRANHDRPEAGMPRLRSVKAAAERGTGAG